MSRQDEPANADFQTQEYWDSRYAAERPEEDFDWFKTYDELKTIFHGLIGDRSARILMLGCGNSTLTADMAKDGYGRITSIDYSGVIIDKMQARHPEQDWRVMDVRQLQENADDLGGLGTWDVIIDKGTMDALMAEKGSVWDPSEAVRENVKAEIDGVLR